VEILSKIKKTYLCPSQWVSTPAQTSELKQWFTNPAVEVEAKITTVKEIFNLSRWCASSKKPFRILIFKAFETLDKMNLDAAKKMF
jgi:geranylgeranyl diphosphate synthase type II